MTITNNNRIKRFALSFSAVLIIVWALLGTGTSLAWFTDTTEELRNVINIADFELGAYYLADDGKYKTIEGQSDIFKDNALYEPGYTQVVYFRVNNHGSVPFDYQTAVIVLDSQPALNQDEEKFWLEDHLKFGLVTAATEAELTALVATRDLAAAIAVHPLDNYETSAVPLAANSETYMALVIRMPEEVGNEANYSEPPEPEVQLGISVTATQKQN